MVETMRDPLPPEEEEGLAEPADAEESAKRDLALRLFDGAGAVKDAGAVYLPAGAKLDS